MKKRVLSAMLALIIIIPFIISGGFFYKAAICIISILSTREYLHTISTKKEVPTFISFISYIIISLLVLFNANSSDLSLNLDFRIISGLFLVYLLPAILYHDRQKYSIVDAFAMIGVIFFLGASFSILIAVRNISLELLIYLLLIPTITDTFAYIVGSLIGRHKMLEQISPSKTLEGMIAGSMMGTIVATSYYFSIINSQNLLLVFFITLFLTILGQYGDLTFSAIKRYYKIKDFSNIMPGHGGLLDRLDSIIFVVLGFMFFAFIL